VVVGMERGGNMEPCAVVTLRGDGDAGKIVARANESLADFQRMRVWFEWPEEDFPRTNTQKPRRNVIREMAEAATKSALFGQAPREKWGTQENPAQQIWQTGVLNELIARVSGGRQGALVESTNLDSDLGLSSLDRVELMSALEDRYQVDLSETRFTAVKTVGDLERMLRGEAAPGAGYHYPNWVLRWPVTWLRFAAHYLLMRPAIMLLGWPRIEGREHLRGVKGPLLVVSNHVADVDAGFILTALPARFRHRLAVAAGGEALETLRTRPANRNVLLRMYDRVQWLMGVTLLNLFPLPREAGFRRSFAYAGEAVDRGYSVLVFPEGRHTKDGKMNPFRAGIGLLAQNLRIPVLPIRIVGLFEVKHAGKKFTAPWKIRVRIGEPKKFEPGTSAETIAAELQKTVENL
jgi:long-chain acyl-CoA synthetase